MNIMAIDWTSWLRDAWANHASHFGFEAAYVLFFLSGLLVFYTTTKSLLVSAIYILVVGAIGISILGATPITILGILLGLLIFIMLFKAWKDRGM